MEQSMKTKVFKHPVRRQLTRKTMNGDRFPSTVAQMSVYGQKMNRNREFSTTGMVLGVAQVRDFLYILNIEHRI